MESLQLTFAIFGSLSLATIGLCLATNRWRERKDYDFKLKPNCLLTRYPVVFVTGQRSLFYYRRYWNAFPVLLAEHGYEVFSVQLPWTGPLRLEKMREFLKQHETERKTFHFVMDASTEQEFAQLLKTSPAVLSVTIPKAESVSFADSSSDNIFGTTRVSNPAPLVRLSFACHRQWRSLSGEHTVSDLGAAFPKGASMLLERMQYLGEQDYLR